MFLVVRALTCGIGLAMPVAQVWQAPSWLFQRREHHLVVFTWRRVKRRKRRKRRQKRRWGGGGLRFERLVRAEKVSLGRSKDIVWSHETRGIKKTKFVEFDWEGVERVEILYWILLEFGE